MGSIATIKVVSKPVAPVVGVWGVNYDGETARDTISNGAEIDTAVTPYGLTVFRAMRAVGMVSGGVSPEYSGSLNIVGTAAEDEVVTVDEGTWIGAYSAPSYAWIIDSVEVGTGKTFTVPAGQTGKDLYVVITIMGSDKQEFTFQSPFMVIE